MFCMEKSLLFKINADGNMQWNFDDYDNGYDNGDGHCDDGEKDEYGNDGDEVEDVVTWHLILEHLQTQQAFCS